MKARSELDEVAGKLESLLKRYANRLTTVKDARGTWLFTRQAVHKGKPFMLYGLRRGKNYVSYYVVPLYMFPELANGISAALKQRLQGKACFNFTHIDEARLRELRSLTDAGFKRFRDSAFYKEALSKRQSSATSKPSGRPTPSAR